ncbi:hypothetical protein SESBI_29423 [Sesbania bispinosa]|nr:hypothetical protein SESBI_29423 [Sesbania bispinosa]
MAQAWRDREWATSSGQQQQMIDGHSRVDDQLDFENIDNIRIRSNLFYKLEQSSKEFEEYNLEFHRKKSSKKKDDRTEEVNKAKTTPNMTSKAHEFAKSKSVMPWVDEINDMFPVNKRQRTPTLTSLQVLIMNHFAWTSTYQKPLFVLAL